MKHKLFTLTTLIAILFSCSKDDHKIIVPEVITIGVEMVTEEGAYIHGEYIVPKTTHIVDHGFIYYLSNYFYQEKPDFTSMYKYSLGESSKNKLEFFGTINKNLIKGKEFVVCSYVKTDSEIMYGELFKFISQCGEIDGWLSFEPQLAGIGDTITIKGKYLKQPYSYAEVGFGNSLQKAFYATDTLLKVTVPNSINMLQLPLTINVAGNYYQSEKDLHIKPPVINSVSDKYVVSGKKIKLYGKYMNLIDEISIDGKKLKRYYNDFEVESNNIIKITIPRGIKTGDLLLEIKYLENTSSFDNLLTGILPTIESFSPHKVWYNDTVKIKGQNLNAIYTFKHPSLTYTSTSVLSKSDTLIKLLVRNLVPNDTLVAYYNGIEVKSQSKLYWIPPSIHSVEKATIYGRDQITIKGEKFITGTELQIGDQNSNSYNVVDENTITYWVEAKAGKHKLSLHYEYPNYFDTLTDIEVDVLKAEIVDISPNTFMRGQKLRVTAKNINPIDQYAQFKIENHYCKVLERNGDEFLVQFEIDKPMAANMKMTLGYGVQELEYPETLNFVEPWEYVSETNFEGNVHYLGICKGKPTLIDNGEKIYQFNSNNESWEFFSSLDLSDAYFMGSTVYEDKLILSYYNDGHELAIYSMSDKTLTRIERDEKQEKLYGNIFTFLNGNEFYIGSYRTFICFNLDNHTWSEKSKAPQKFRSENKTVSFTINNQGYLAFEWGLNGYNGMSDFYKYDFDNDEWIQHDGFTANIKTEAATIIYKEKAYLAHHGEYGLIGLRMYNPVNDKWEGFVPPPGDGRNYHIFELNGYLYFSNSFWSPKRTKTYKMPIDGLIPLEH
ncbi:IPT/TIG domain-containing protein [Ancylomarina sp. YFZ004]